MGFFFNVILTELWKVFVLDFTACYHYYNCNIFDYLSENEGKDGIELISNKNKSNHLQYKSPHISPLGIAHLSLPRSAFELPHSEMTKM